MDSYLLQLEEERAQKVSDEAYEREHKKKVKQWTTFYRRNWEIYAEERLRIKLRPYQRIMLHHIGTSQVFFAVCARGLAKSFIAALAAVIYCLLYPYAQVVITASTIDQAKKMLDNKIRNELIGKLSPVLHYMFEKGLIKIVSNNERAEAIFWNGSNIIILPPIDSSRGQRSNFLIYEECRLLRAGDVNSIFEPMAYPRQPIYLQRDEYSSDPDCIEEARSIYITSSRYSTEWWYRMVKKVIMACYEEAVIPYNFFMADIYTAIKYGLKSKQEWLKIQKNSSQIDIDAEYLNIPLGEGEDAFFSLEQFKACQTVKQAFTPPTDMQIVARSAPKNRAKKKGEVRFLVCDFAFATTVRKSAAFENDNTVIMCMSAQPNKGTFDRVPEYIETIDGGESDATVKRIRELYHDYECDWILIDARSGGETIYNELTRPYDHPTRVDWDNRGFSVCKDMRMQMCSKTKIDDLVNRTVDPNAIQCIIPILATDTSNDLMWRSLATHLAKGDVRLLIDELTFEDTLDNKKYLHLTNEERAQIKLPYVQTELLINEAINLKQNALKGGRIQLKEPRTGKKDRIVCLAYGNDFIDKLENITQYQEERYEDFDESDWEGIFVI